jgi:hypothetical protein
MSPVAAKLVEKPRYLSKLSSLEHPESFVAGAYYFDSSENFDRYLQELGMSYFMRTIAATTKPVMTIYPSGICKQVKC